MVGCCIACCIDATKGRLRGLVAYIQHVVATPPEVSSVKGVLDKRAKV
jgi:hypothetical protein